MRRFVIGCDPGATNCAAVLIDMDSMKAIAWAFNGKKAKDYDGRHGALLSEKSHVVSSMINRASLESAGLASGRLAIERNMFNKLASAFKTQDLIGAIIYRSENQGCKFFKAYPPSMWRKALGLPTSGALVKEAARAKALECLSGLPDSLVDHIYDAACIGLAAIKEIKHESAS